MSAFKKIAGLVAGVSAVGAIGVAVAQGVPPNPRITNPALGAGEQTATGTLIGETGVLAWSDNVQVQQAAVITREADRAAVASQPVQEAQPVAAAPAPEPTPVAQAPAFTQSMGAGPGTSGDTAPPARAARRDRG